MADFFAPMSDIQSDIMRPIDPLLLVEDGYQRGGYEVGLGSFDIGMDREGQGLGGSDVDMQADYGDQTLGIAPTDPLVPPDIATPVVHLFDTAHQFPGRPGLGAVSDVMDVFNVARFLFEGR